MEQDNKALIVTQILNLTTYMVGPALNHKNVEMYKKNHA